jgi:hypothetical protein
LCSDWLEAFADFVSELISFSLEAPDVLVSDRLEEPDDLNPDWLEAH